MISHLYSELWFTLRRIQKYIFIHHKVAILYPLPIVVTLQNNECTHKGDVYLFNVSSLLSSGLELLPLASSRSVGVAMLTDCVGCGGGVAVGGSLALAGEDCVSASYFYMQVQVWWFKVNPRQHATTMQLKLKIQTMKTTVIPRGSNNWIPHAYTWQQGLLNRIQWSDGINYISS